MLVDTHCHIHDSQWFTPEQQAEFLQVARERGVRQVITIGTDVADSAQAKEFAKSCRMNTLFLATALQPSVASVEISDDLFLRSAPRLDGPLRGACPSLTPSKKAFMQQDPKEYGVFWTFGVHPEFAGKSAGIEHVTENAEADGAKTDYAQLVRDLRDERLVAIGEIGLDYHYEGYDRTAQIKLLEEMLQVAQDQDLPVSLHVREAFADIWAILANFSEIRGVVHSFTGSKKDLRIALEHNFMIGVNGLATYTTTPLPPLERIVLETDAPFLTPVPFRGTINQPGYVAVIAQYLAEKLGVAEKLIVEQTTKNAREIFKI